MPSQSRTCRYVHAVGVTYRIREMEKVRRSHRITNTGADPPPLLRAVSHGRATHVHGIVDPLSRNFSEKVMCTFCYFLGGKLGFN
ncbi:hypothetical protein F2Q69_00029061 [Brassica cretica]|uniref:Uncharacterized protein n=1 Tax=Brassica cretica TaxID=69181 RepID=A0A8S9RU42_BRACR|nr:hypothetical protein F2Q69_00029061 [Brassica cretica]